MVVWFSQLILIAASLSLQLTPSESSPYNVVGDSVKASKTTNFCDWKADLSTQELTQIESPSNTTSPDSVTEVDRLLPPWLRTTIVCIFGIAILWHVGSLDFFAHPKAKKECCKSTQKPWVNPLHNLTPIQVENQFPCNLELDEDEDDDDELFEDDEVEPQVPPRLEAQLSDETFGLPQSPPARTKAEECVVCRIGMKEYAFNPCGHLACCMSCAHTVRDCPLCRSPKKSLLRVYQC